MTKMATNPIYGKNLEKIFFSRTNGLMATGPVVTKFHKERPWAEGKQSRSHDKHGPMPVHGKNV